MTSMTFMVELRPFERLRTQAYVFQVHAPSREATMEWIVRVFTGIEVEPAVKDWSEELGQQRTNKFDPIVITECSPPRIPIENSPGTTSTPATSEQQRSSTLDVAGGLFEIFNRLQAERIGFQHAFRELTVSYTRSQRTWEYDRLTKLKDAMTKLLVWQNNVWAEYSLLESQNEFILPTQQVAA